MTSKRPRRRRAIVIVPLVAVGALAAGIVVANALGIRVTLSGSGLYPVFERPESESHYREIEADREGNAAPVPTPAAAAPDNPPAAAVSERTTDSAEPAANYWTEFRGPGRAGIYAQQPIDTNWPAQGPPELWRQKIGGGYASMSIAEGKVYTIEQRRDREVVAAYDFETGRQVWERAWRARFSESMGGDGPRATPTWHDGKIYALGAVGDLYCLDAADGAIIWKRNILSDAGAVNLTWGMAAAPLIVDDFVVVLPGGRSGKSVIAYDRGSGEIRWTAQDDRQGYTSPQVATLAGRRQLVIVSGVRIFGANVEDGSLLWEHEWETDYDANCAQPLIVDGEHVFLSAGYGHGATLLKIEAAENRFSSREIWFSRSMKNKFNPSVLVDGVVYGLDNGILAAVDVRTGERLWKGGRYRFGQLLYASGHLIVVSEQGDLALVEATPEAHREIVKFEALSGKTWNVPAMADGRLIVRNQTEMVAYDLRP